MKRNPIEHNRKHRTAENGTMDLKKWKMFLHTKNIQRNTTNPLYTANNKTRNLQT